MMDDINDYDDDDDDGDDDDERWGRGWEWDGNGMVMGLLWVCNYPSVYYNGERFGNGMMLNNYGSMIVMG